MEHIVIRIPVDHFLQWVNTETNQTVWFGQMLHRLSRYSRYSITLLDFIRDVRYIPLSLMENANILPESLTIPSQYGPAYEITPNDLLGCVEEGYIVIAKEIL